jgi:hypothetical protein
MRLEIFLCYQVSLHCVCMRAGLTVRRVGPEKVNLGPAMPPTPSSSFAPNNFASSQTNSERADKWSLNSMDQLVWVAVGENDATFWWPGDVRPVLL